MDDWILKDGNTVLDYEEIKERLNEEIQFLDTSVSLCPDDFYVEYYETNSSKSEILSLNSVESPFALNQQIEGIDTFNSFSNAAESSSVLSSWTIDGSHYEYIEMGDHLKKVWYNQITDSQSNICVTPSSPYGGDGNNRTDSGYPWFPYYIKAEFIQQMNMGDSFVSLSFRFDENQLQNLNYDDNEALEMEIVFYNYKNADNQGERGVSFVPVNGNPSVNTEGKDFRNPKIWLANFSCAYLDTSAFDKTEEVSVCVGCYDAQAFSEPEKLYKWDIRYQGFSLRQNLPNDGRFKVIAQRSYLIDASIVNDPDLIPFRVFSEEKEGMIKYGLDSEVEPETGKLQLWVDSIQNAFDHSFWECNLKNGDSWRNY